jgi:DUF4097 and DUF4098 domain-containing protein YvlB
MLVAAIAVGSIASAAAAKDVNERRPLDADGVVTVKNINGSITVEGWDRKELEVTGTYTGDIEEVEISGTESRMRVEVKFPENQRNTSGSADLRIKLPAAGGVRVSVVNAEITVSKFDGDVDLEAVNGEVVVSGRPKQVAAKTVNGGIQISGGGTRVEAESVGGEIVLTGVAGDVRATSVGASIEVTGGRLERGEFQSVSGSIDVTCELDGKATFQTESHSGDIDLHFPANVSAEFEVSTFSGDIHNDFGPTGTKRQYGPGRNASFTTGGGDAQVSVSTFSGDVRLLKK